MLFLGSVFTIMGAMFLILSLAGIYYDILKFLLLGVLLLILGIVFITIGKKTSKKLELLEKENTQKNVLQKQTEELQHKELEIEILKEKNLSKTNQNVFCAYCGAKLNKDALKCENCGGIVRKK